MACTVSYANTNWLPYTNCLCSYPLGVLSLYSVKFTELMIKYVLRTPISRQSEIHGRSDGPAFWEWKIQDQLQVFGQVNIAFTVVQALLGRWRVWKWKC